VEIPMYKIFVFLLIKRYSHIIFLSSSIILSYNMIFFKILKSFWKWHFFNLAIYCTILFSCQKVIFLFLRITRRIYNSIKLAKYYIRYTNFYMITSIDIFFNLLDFILSNRYRIYHCLDFVIIWIDITE